MALLCPIDWTVVGEVITKLKDLVVWQYIESCDTQRSCNIASSANTTHHSHSL